MQKPRPLPQNQKKWSTENLRRNILGVSRAAAWGALRGRIKRSYRYLHRLVDAFNTHQCSLMACACAYCALLSLVPLLIVGIAAVGYVVGGSTQALHKVIVAINGYIPIRAEFIKETLLHVLQNRQAIGIFGIAGLLFAAHQTFLAMEPAMNIIWGIPENRHWLRQRLTAFGATLYALVLLGMDLAATAFFTLLRRYSLQYLPGTAVTLLYSVGFGLLPVLLTTLLFAILYRALPARTVPWKSAFIGAAVAALLWELTKVGFGYFLIYVHSYDRLYGSFSSVVILVVWAFYSMTILLLGAEVAADYETMRHGARAAEERAHSGADLTAATGKEVSASSPHIPIIKSSE